MPFLMPVRAGDRNGRRKLGAGLALYDLLAGRRTRAWQAPAAARQQVPPLAETRLQGAWQYVDAQTDDARLVWRLLAEARRLGALVLNYAPVQRLHRGSRGVEGAQVQDAEGERSVAVAARCVINATGVWADGLRAQLDRAPKLRPLRGSHLVLPGWRLPLSQAVAFFHPDDGRPVFALPWEGATLVGTTDLDHLAPLDVEPAISRGELTYLLRALQHEFPSLGLHAADVVSTLAGVRPVVASGRRVDPSKEGREHLIVEEDGLVTVTGGKLTTFRDMAAEALRLASARVPALQQLRMHEPVLAASQVLRDLPVSLAARWRARHGSVAAQVRDRAAPGELQPVAGTDVTWADLRWACHAESVVHLDDLLLRRTRLGLLLPEGARACWSRVQAIAQEELGWDGMRWQLERERYQQLIERCHSVPAQAEE
jgi:glycerol-3-phosphate dehydrogenase